MSKADAQRGSLGASQQSTCVLLQLVPSAAQTERWHEGEMWIDVGPMVPPAEEPEEEGDVADEEGT